MPKPLVRDGCSMPHQILWTEQESKEVCKKILLLSDNQIKKLFERSGLIFYRDEKREKIPLSEIVAEIRKEGVNSGKFIALLNEGFLDYCVDGKELFRCIEEIRKESR